MAKGEALATRLRGALARFDPSWEPFAGEVSAFAATLGLPFAVVRVLRAGLAAALAALGAGTAVSVTVTTAGLASTLKVVPLVGLVAAEIADPPGTVADG